MNILQTVRENTRHVHPDVAIFAKLDAVLEKPQLITAYAHALIQLMLEKQRIAFETFELETRFRKLAGGVDFNTYVAFAEALRRALGESKSVKIVKLGSYYSLEHAVYTAIPRERETCPEIRSVADVFRRIIRAHKSKYESRVGIEGVMYALSDYITRTAHKYGLNGPEIVVKLAEIIMPKVADLDDAKIVVAGRTHWNITSAGWSGQLQRFFEIWKKPTSPVWPSSSAPAPLRRQDNLRSVATAPL